MRSNIAHRVAAKNGKSSRVRRFRADCFRVRASASASISSP